MKVPFYGHVKQYQAIKEAIDSNIQTVLESGQYVMGPMLERFERELADYHGMKFAVGVANGTDALWLTFLALGIGLGDECVTTTNTFFATAEAIWIANATAVFVESDPRTNCIDPSRIEAAITPKTKALVPVHLYGQCADMRAIRKIADNHNLFVIEDNAQAIGARGDGFAVGELSDAVCTSFITQKNLGRIVRKLDLLELILVDRHRIELAIMAERHVESARSVPLRPHRPSGLDESSPIPGHRLSA